MANYNIVVKIDPTGAERGGRQVEQRLKNVTSAADRTRAMLARAFAFATASVGLVGSIRLLADYEQQMSTVRAISGATEQQFKALRAEATLLGSTTRFSASQAAEGMTFLARAGFDVEQTLGAIGGTLQLAQAGALDLGRAADITSNILTGFRMQVSETGHLVDVLALASNAANTDVGQLGEAMKFVAPVAAGLGVSVEEATAAVSALSDAGLQGSLAGTGLRRVLSELESPSSKMLAFLADMGLKAEDVQVSQVGLTQALRALARTGIDTGTALELFGDRGGPAFEVMSQAIPRIEELTDRLNNADGTAQRIAETMDDNLNGALLGVTSAFESVIIALGDGGASSGLTGAAKLFAGMLRTVAANIDTLIVAVEMLAVVLISRMLSAFVVSVMGAVAQMVALEVALGATTTRAALLGVALKGVQGIMMLIAANPLTAILTVIGGVAIGLSLMESNTEEVARVTSELTTTVDSLRDAYERANGQLDLMEESASNITLSQALQQQAEAADVLETNIGYVRARLDGLRTQIQNGFGGSEARVFYQDVVRLRDGLDDGSASLQEVITLLDQMGQATPDLRGVVNSIIEMAQEAVPLEQQTERAEAVIRLLSGTATSADRALLGMGGAAVAAAGDVNVLTGAANQAVSALRTLQGFIPELARANAIQADLTEAQAAYQAGRAELVEQVGNGMSIDAAAAGIQELTDTYNRAQAEITGQAAAQRDATEALEDYTQAAQVSAVTGLDRTLLVLEQNYSTLRDSLVEAGAAQEQLTAAEEAYQAQVAAARRDDAAAGAGGASGGTGAREARTAAATARRELQEQERLTASVVGNVDALRERWNEVQRLFDEGSISVNQYNNELMNTNIQLAEMRITAGDGSLADGFLVQLSRMTQGLTSFRSQAGTILGGFFTSFSEGFANSIGRAIVYSENLGDSLREVARSALSELISGFVKMGLQWITQQVLARTLGAAATAISGTQAAATAAAWAPAAAMASLATLGANAVPAGAAIASTVALTTGLAAAGAAFAEGTSYVTGPGTRTSDSVLAALSVGEGVVTAQANARNPGVVSAMNSGATITPPGSRGRSTDASASPSGASLNVIVENYGTDVTVERVSATDVRVIAREEASKAVRDEAPGVVASDLGRPNGRVSKALASNTKTQRRRS